MYANIYVSQFVLIYYYISIIYITILNILILNIPFRLKYYLNIFKGVEIIFSFNFKVESFEIHS